MEQLWQCERPTEAKTKIVTRATHTIRAQLLFIEDDERFICTLGTMLAQYSEHIVVRPSEFRDIRIEVDRFHVALIDLDTVHFDIVSLIRRLREGNPHALLFVHSRSEVEEQAVLAYEAGADDFFARSTDILVLAAKMRRALRRATLEIGDMATTHGTLVERLDAELTRSEQRLLRLFVREANRVLPTPQIIEQLWGRSTYDPNRLYEHISTLRAKLALVDWTVVNLRGQGYRLEPLKRL